MKKKATKTTTKRIQRRKPAAVMVESLGDSLQAQGLSRSNWSETQQTALSRGFEPADLEIQSDGVVNVPASLVAERLNKVFLPGNWGMSRVGDPQCTAPGGPEDPGYVIVPYVLWVNGIPVAEAYGKGTWARRVDYGNSVEAARTNGLKRCTKHIIAPHIYSDNWQHRFKLANGYLVERITGPPAWRSMHGAPLEDEVDIDPRSPNQKTYTPPSVVEKTASRRPVKRKTAAKKAVALPKLSDDPIPTKAIGQIMQAARAHERTEADVDRYIRRKWGHRSKAKITAAQFDTVIAWARGPRVKK